VAEEAEEDGSRDEDNAIWPSFARDGDEGGLGRQAAEVNTSSFELLSLPPAVAAEVQMTWSAYLHGAESREAAGEAVLAAIFESAPSLQSLFKTPRAVMAMRFMIGLQTLVAHMDAPDKLKTAVETLGFQHLEMEVTVPRVTVFRDAILDLLATECGDKFTALASDGWHALLNYVGGAFIYIRLTYVDRLRILAKSWATANNKKVEEATVHGSDASTAGDDPQDAAGKQEDYESIQNSPKEAEARKALNEMGGSNIKVPTTFNEMFLFNAAVMGFARSTWMSEVLSSFDAIVTNVSNSGRLQEECDVLVLRLAKHRGGGVHLGEYKAVMLASLRSLVPAGWDSEHEVAWSWLWENVERLVRRQLDRPAKQERALEKLWSGMDDAQQAVVRADVYAKFFALSPAGQDYFKQSATRLHFIADRIVAMSLAIFRDPKQMVEDISALGLRHVGYGIPTELFGPFVTAYVQVVRENTVDEVAEEAFRWSLNLISRILVRVINEGSTIVMKAINVNSAPQLRKAVACAPRSQRALWVLNIQVGTQSISPLLWAIETGSLDAAKAILVDLLTIRADRDRYYYGMDTMFERHPDIVQRLCQDAPLLLPTLLDRLIWRSRLAEGGQRRVNYYLKHLLLDAAGGFSPTLQWIAELRDPKIICHPVVVMLTDTVWSRLAFRVFLYGKVWFLFTLLVFISAQSVLPNLHAGVDVDKKRIAIFSGRCFIYSFSMGQWIYYHVKKSYIDVFKANYTRILHMTVPGYLQNWQDSASLMLTFCLVLMFCIEPILLCLQSKASRAFGPLAEDCPQAESLAFSYSVFSMMSMLLYYALLVDMSVFSTRISAFVLVCSRVLPEIALFLAGMSFTILTLSSAVAALRHQNEEFSSIPRAALSMVQVVLRMTSDGDFDALEEDPGVMAAVVCLVIVGSVSLVNLLIAQLSCSYAASYEDMLGFARLRRAQIVVQAMPSVSRRRWESFVASLRLDVRIEFGEGDVGLAGGIRASEPATAHATSEDTIKRYGGSTSASAQWPEDPSTDGATSDRCVRMERLLRKAVKHSKKFKGAASSGPRQGSGMNGFSGMSGGSGSDAGSDGGHDD